MFDYRPARQKGRKGKPRSLRRHVGDQPQRVRPRRPPRRGKTAVRDDATGWRAALAGLPAHGSRAVFALAVLWLLVGMIVEGRALWIAPLRKVEVKGNRSLPVEAVVRQAGFGPGLPLGELDPLEIAARLGQLPRVRAADVRRIFPGRIAIVMQEREPAAEVEISPSVIATVDRQGLVLAVAPSGPVKKHGGRKPLPRIRYGKETPIIGQRLGGLQLQRALGLLRDIAVLRLERDEPFLIDANDPFAIALGFPAENRRVLLPPAAAAAALGKYAAIAPSLPEASGKMQTLDFRTADARHGGRVVMRR